MSESQMRTLSLQHPLMSGADVVRLQRRLSELGFGEDRTPDGYYGPATIRAVQQFQRAMGLVADGVAGAGTLARLLPREATPLGRTRPVLRFQLPLVRGGDVSRLQQRLRALGLLTSGIDGAFDAETASAVKRFQELAGVAADGIVGQATWQSLMGPPTVVAPVPTPARACSPADTRLVIADSHLAQLNAWHMHFPGGSKWRLHRDGIGIDEAAAHGSGGDPATARHIWRSYRSELEAASIEFHVPVELLVATIATESSGRSDATRLEPGYSSDAATPHRVSVGLTQTLISTARAALRDPAVDRNFLLRPLGAIRAGAAYIAQQRNHTMYDPPLVACAYNAGSIRENKSARNRWRMVQYPIGTSAHADRFVAFFNDCLRVFDEDRPAAPSFKDHVEQLSAG